MLLKTLVQNGIETVMCTDQKLTVGLPFPGGIAAGVFLGAHGPGFRKSPELHLHPQAKYLKFNPQTPKSG